MDIHWVYSVTGDGSTIITGNCNGRSVTRRITAQQIHTKYAPQFALATIKADICREIGCLCYQKSIL